jgi:hypothetical protein
MHACHFLALENQDFSAEAVEELGSPPIKGRKRHGSYQVAPECKAPHEEKPQYLF